jgi:pyruvate,water dikinase
MATGTKPQSSYVLGFQDIDRTMLLDVGGKGAHLGELSKVEGIRVPDGFCISTNAYQRAVGETPAVGDLIERLSRLTVENRREISALSGEIRRAIAAIALPEAVIDDLTRRLSVLGETHAYAIRSSATAEDLPSASFAGQHETYLNVVGKEAILKHISKCWASLFTERAVTYRIQHGFDHRNVHLSVVIQKMIVPHAAGVLFTADPVTSNRKVVSIDAIFGLGEALVSGLVNADTYTVRAGQITDSKVATKKLAIHALPEGGTEAQAIAPEQQNLQVLTDEQIRQLAQMGRTIEAHFGQPQDIEWCLADDTFYIVQSRPITTLFPLPEANDQGQHVYLSVGHQQMMTDAMRPLGLSLFQLTAMRPMFKAGGRLFVDITANLASPAGRTLLLDNMGQHDPLMQDALAKVIQRGALVDAPPGDTKEPVPVPASPTATPARFQGPLENHPAIVSELISRHQTSIQELRQAIESKAGPELFAFIRQDIQVLKGMMADPQSSAVYLTAINASRWLNECIYTWLGEKNVADALSQSVPNNITSEMGLALLDLADALRPFPEVIAYLQRAGGDPFLDGLVSLEGGPQARAALTAYLDTYGMRCAGEIDLTRPRWSETPSALVPLLLSNIKTHEPQAGARKFEQGRQDALRKETELLERLKQLPDGEEKASETKRVIDLLRNFIGYREYPKYVIVNRYFIYRQALLQEAERLTRAEVLRQKEDIYYLTFDELQEVVRTGLADDALIRQRKIEHQAHERLTPPRVITSDGEVMMGEYHRENLPAGALAGLAVSSGVIEGRARVILDMAGADLEAGDILVTRFTDPGWTPLFVSISALVTEVGGLMTHGAVIAREYGLPAVVGVENATTVIKEGQRIRVHGTNGYVELL